MKLFGIDFSGNEKNKSVTKALDIDATERAESQTIITQGDTYGEQFNYLLNGTLIPQEDIDLIEYYRTMATTSLVDRALTEIRSQVFSFNEPGRNAFDVCFKDNNFQPSETIKNKIVEEFNNIYHLMDFRNRGMKYFNDFYVDGRYYWQMVIDSNNPKAGIKEVLPLDPLDIRRVILQEKRDKEGLYDTSKRKEFFVYSKNLRKKFKSLNSLSFFGSVDTEFSTYQQIHEDAMVYVTSGQYDRNNDRVISHLFYAIPEYRRFNMSEDTMLIFRIVRAPMRLAFYIDVGSIAPGKQEEHMKKQIALFKNKLTYNTADGKIDTDKAVRSVLENYWLPRTSTGRTTEIDQIDGQHTQDILEEVEYYKKRLIDSLKVPYARFGDNQPVFNFGGRVAELSQEEYRFNKFLQELRSRFVEGVYKVLKTQLVLKKIITPKDWDESISKSLYLSIEEDNKLVELKEVEAFMAKLNLVEQIKSHIGKGKYYSHQYVIDNILQQTAEEQETIRKQNEEWEKLYGQPPADESNFE